MNATVFTLSARLRVFILAILATATCLMSGCSGEVASTATALSSPTPLAVATGTPKAAPATAGPPATGTAPGARSEGQAFAGDTIKIGVDLPISYEGTPDPVVINVRDGVQLAIEQANSTGGVVIAGKTYKLQMYALDDQRDRDLGAKNAETFVADPAVLAVVGPFNSEVAFGDMPIFNRAGLAQISPSNTNPALTKPQYGQTADLRPTGKLTYFRMLTTDDLQGPAEADYMYEKLNIRKIYILNDMSDYGKELEGLVARRFREDGGTVLGRESMPADTQDFQTVLKKLAETKPDALFYAGIYNHGLGLARKQMVESGLNIPFFGGDHIYSAQFIRDAGAGAEGSYTTVTAVNPMVLPTAQQFLADFKARFGTEPTSDTFAYVAPGYDAANIIIAAMKRAARPDRESVRQQIAATKEYQGTVGSTSFDENGDTTNRIMSIYTVKDGKWTFQDHVTYLGTPPSLP